MYGRSKVRGVYWFHSDHGMNNDRMVSTDPEGLNAGTGTRTGTEHVTHLQ